MMIVLRFDSEQGKLEGRNRDQLCCETGASKDEAYIWKRRQLTPVCVITQPNVPIHCALSQKRLSDKLKRPHSCVRNYHY
jgi:hypothetical protein